MSSEQDRYSRQIKIAGWDQSAVRNSKIIIIGVGALGSTVALNLVMAGIGELVLIDMDTIELSNLNRQFLWRIEDKGKFKAETAKYVLQQFNSGIKITHFNTTIQDVPPSVFSRQSSQSEMVLVDALDNFEARRYVNNLAVHNNLPLVSGGMYATLGNVQVIIPQVTACLECQPLIPEHELQKACTLPGEVRTALQEKQQAELSLKLDLTDRVPLTSEEYFPALGSVSSIIGGIMSHEVLKLLHKNSVDMPVLDNYLFVDVNHQSYISIPLNRREDCVVCSTKYHLEGIPYYIDPADTLYVFKEKVAYQFSLNLKNIVLIANGQELIDAGLAMQNILETTNTIYIMGQEIPAPIKLLLKISST